MHFPAAFKKSSLEPLHQVRVSVTREINNTEKGYVVFKSLRGRGGFLSLVITVSVGWEELSPWVCGVHVAKVVLPRAKAPSTHQRLTLSSTSSLPPIHLRFCSPS